MSDASPISDPDALEHRVLIEQVELMSRLTPLPLFGSIGVGAIMAYLAVQDFGLVASVSWYVAAVAISLVRWQVATAFIRKPREYEEVLRWRSAMFALIVLFGAIWSIPAGFLLPLDPRQETIMTVVFIGATATGLASLAAVRHAYAALLIPFTLPYGVTQLMSGGDRLGLGFAFLLYLPVMIAIANRQTNTIERQIKLSIENEALVDALRRERDRVADANHELQVQLTQHQLSSERIRLLNQDLELRAEELRAANDDLEGFSYSVSHDLRSPLRAIDGFSSLIERARHSHNAAEFDHYLQRIHDNVARMSQLIDDLLSFARYGRRPLEAIDLPMDEVVRAALSELRVARAAHGDAASIVIEPMPCARGDRVLLLQVWINLIDNALKYSSKSAQPKIVIRGREEIDRLVYEITDNGVGFDARFSSKLFGVFERLHAASEFPGTGVGLAIVRRIVKRHGGETWANSELDKGATFGFSLPKSQESAGIAVVGVSAETAELQA
jgi:signal transduction histidine kinase